STIITLAASGNVEGLEILGNPKQDAKDMDVCVGCAMGKIHRSPFPSINNIHAEKGALIHSDTCGPMQVPSFGGNRYLVTFIDDAARFIRGFLIPDKKASTVLGAFKIFKNLAETKLAKRIQAIRTDNGIEYQGVLKDYLKDQGIEHQVTTHTPRSPMVWLNGTTERLWRWYDPCFIILVILSSSGEKLSLLLATSRIDYHPERWMAKRLSRSGLVINQMLPI